MVDVKKNLAWRKEVDDHRKWSVDLPMGARALIGFDEAAKDTRSWVFISMSPMHWPYPCDDPGIAFVLPEKCVDEASVLAEATKLLLDDGYVFLKLFMQKRLEKVLREGDELSAWYDEHVGRFR